jgi:hypothetical protein
MIFFLTYHAVPDISHSDYSKIKGAYINCWIAANNLEIAKIISSKTVEDLKWEILNLEDAYPISLSDYASGSKGIEFHERALIDKEVYQIHTYTE